MAQSISDQDFQSEVLNAKGMPVLVDFYADWCGPCQTMLPVIEKLAKEMEGKAKIVKVNVDESSEYASKYGVMSIPALKIFRDGEIVENMVGIQSEQELRTKLEAHM